MRWRLLQTVGHHVNRQGDLPGWHIVGSHKAGTSPCPPTRIFKVYPEALTGFSHVYCPDGLDSMFLPQDHSLENSSYCGNRGRITFKGQGRGCGARCLAQAGRSSCGPLLSLLQQLAVEAGRSAHCLSPHARPCASLHHRADETPCRPPTTPHGKETSFLTKKRASRILSYNVSRIEVIMQSGITFREFLGCQQFSIFSKFIF